MGGTQHRNFCLITVSLLLIISLAAADSQIRLAGSGSTRCSGRVEIYYNHTWGTVCDDYWDLNDANVVCRELGCGTALNASQLAYFGRGTGQIWLDNVDCSGNERSLNECQHRGFGINNCGHHEDAGVVCSGITIRLSGSTLCSGRVEIYYNDTWGTVCEDNWDLNDATVVCRELGCGAAQHAVQNVSSGKGSGQRWLNKVGCFGKERSLTQCRHGGFQTHDCTHSEGAGVVCLPSLPQPSISMDYGGEVTWGQDAVITCLISPHTQQRLSGTFILNQTSGSLRVEQASNNSATFRISKVDFVDEGSYRCQYQTQVSSQDFFSSLSASVRLSVAVPFLLLVSSVAAGILLLLLLVLVVVCLVLRRRQQSKQPGGVVQTQLMVRNKYEEDNEESEEEEGDYVNVEPVDTNQIQTGQAEGDEDEDDDDHDYEEAQIEDDYIVAVEVSVNMEHNREEQVDEEETSDDDDDNDYENATQPFTEQEVDIYGGNEDIYQNL